MRAMMFEAFGARPEIRTLPDPTPTPAGVVIKVEATGLCVRIRREPQIFGLRLSR